MDFGLSVQGVTEVTTHPQPMAATGICYKEDPLVCAPAGACGASLKGQRGHL